MTMWTKPVRRWGIAAAAAALAAGAVGGGAVARAQQGQQPRDPTARCARPAGLMTQDDREAIGRIFMNRVKEKLGLSDQQAEDFRNTLKAMRDDARADWQALCQTRVELRTLMDQQNSDPAAVKAAGDRVKTLQAKLVDRRLDTYLALRSKLTAEQWVKWVELRKERARRFRGGFRGFTS